MMIAIVLAQALAQVLDSEFASAALNGSLCGVYVSGGNAAYERNADTRLVPASNQKILTVAYALKRLGPDHVFTVKIWKEGTGASVSTDGHPALTFAELANARESLSLKPGPIRVRAGYPTLMPPSWEWDDLPNKYAAKPSAFTVDRGSFELWGGKGKAFFSPVSYGVKVMPVKGTAVRVDYDPSQSVARVIGTLPAAPSRLDTLALPDPARAAALALGGQFESAQTEPTRSADLTLKSTPLIAIATECLQKSDNNFAENLLLCAAATEGPLGDKPYEVAAKRLAAFLESEVGVAKGHVRPIDGSGMSRHNLVTPRALAKVLDYARATWGDVWLNALATSGKGTLQNRLAGSPFRGKTGSLNSVQSISGYTTDISGKPHVIVLVFNNTIAPASEIRAIQDSIVRKIEANRDGTVLDAYDHREGRSSDPHHSPVDWYWHH